MYVRSGIIGVTAVRTLEAQVGYMPISFETYRTAVQYPVTDTALLSVSKVTKSAAVVYITCNVFALISFLIAILAEAFEGFV
jgi:hypothetical protein